MAFLLGVLVTAFVVVMVAQSTAQASAEASAVAEARTVALNDASDLDELAARFGVTIVWTDDDRNCGLGCYRRGTPDVIYVEPGHDVVKTRHIVLHEVGHALHHRLGLPTSEEDADQFADAMVGPTGGQ